MFKTRSISPREASALASSRINLLCLPYDIRYRVYEVCLLSTGETSLNMISRSPKSGTTRDPLVSYLGRVESINYAVESWRLQHNISILQTCKTVNVEKTPILYGRNTFLLTLNLHRPERDVSPTQNGLADAEIAKTR